LLCAVTCVWGFVRYTETESTSYAALAGFAAGTSILFKQTGLYLLVALVIAFLYGRAHRTIRVSAAIVSIGLAIAVLRSRLGGAESLYLLLPVVSCAALVAAADERKTDEVMTTLRIVAVAVICAALPLAAGVLPYVMNGSVGTLLNGLFVLPQRRLQFASLAMSHPYFILVGVPCVALVSPLAHRVAISSSYARLVTIGLSLAAAVILVVSFRRYAAYQLIWQSARAFAALLPVLVCWYLFTRRHDDVKGRRILFAATAMLAWASLVQFPFSGSIYFCYTVPLAVIAGAASARHFSTFKHPALIVWCSTLIAFGVSSMNRGYLDNLGAWHQRIALDRSLDLPRAHFNVKAEEVATYRRVNALVTRHVGRGELLAGPDAPEVYFLAGRLNPSGVLFDFFSGGIAGEDDTAWAGTRVVVLNHRPGFSPAPSEQLAANIRSLFPNGESVGRFEVRWR
jgi:hypothetical protein